MMAAFNALPTTRNNADVVGPCNPETEQLANVVGEAVAVLKRLRTATTAFSKRATSLAEACRRVRYQDEVKLYVVRVVDGLDTREKDVVMQRSQLNAIGTVLELEKYTSAARFEFCVTNPDAPNPSMNHSFGTLTELFEGEWENALEDMLFRRGTLFARLSAYYDKESAKESGDDAESGDESESGAETVPEGATDDDTGEGTGIVKAGAKRRRSAPNRFDIVEASERPQFASKKKRAKKPTRSGVDESMDFSDSDPDESTSGAKQLQIRATCANNNEHELLNRDGMPRRGSLKGMLTDNDEVSSEDAILIKLLFACELKNNGQTRTYEELLPFIARALGLKNPPKQFVGPAGKEGDRLQGQVTRNKQKNRSKSDPGMYGDRMTYWATVDDAEEAAYTIEWDWDAKRLFYDVAED